mmetsp:Transcript_20110/g.57063  ORF Transcript_20110/g.57063 Transcript_20110/m.57063 type:complete len:322 (-) Transcript_20110:50-1015(-)|eukprot:CAMPEP_0119568740 /NCGR_PEP_ID=MMETSP1352-20130426/39678_1 /TAXON_ID=265584 /ORGANISM="Stauroneis constricta, Strain CCMP1120" /LENGTH=321 /DNA_ID=CAMNT_0007618187 /DNA_START=124 /DNA_END=1089 /DNA_ORIENTATION=-
MTIFDTSCSINNHNNADDAQAAMAIKGVAQETATATATSRPKRKYKKRAPPTNPFPRRLFAMLSDAEREGNTHIVSWVDEGRAFFVHDHDLFVSTVLPRYFRQTKYRSFQRQLNNYQIERYISGPLRGAYHHPLLLRGQGKLIATLIRENIVQPMPRLIPVTAASAPSTASVTSSAMTQNLQWNELQQPIPTVSEDDESDSMSECCSDVLSNACSEGTACSIHSARSSSHHQCDFFFGKRFFPVTDAADDVDTKTTATSTSTSTPTATAAGSLDASVARIVRSEFNERSMLQSFDSSIAMGFLHQAVSRDDTQALIELLLT